MIEQFLCEVAEVLHLLAVGIIGKITKDGQKIIENEVLLHEGIR